MLPGLTASRDKHSNVPGNSKLPDCKRVFTLKCQLSHLLLCFLGENWAFSCFEFVLQCFYNFM